MAISSVPQHCSTTEAIQPEASQTSLPDDPSQLCCWSDEGHRPQLMMKIPTDCGHAPARCQHWSVALPMPEARFHDPDVVSAAYCYGWVPLSRTGTGSCCVGTGRKGRPSPTHQAWCTFPACNFIARELPSAVGQAGQLNFPITPCKKHTEASDLQHF